MRIKFLGTGASEGIPSLFCNCPTCKRAREVGGKEVRSRSGMLIDDDFMIDFSSDMFLNSLRHGVDCSRVRHILVSHSHWDHVNVNDIAPQRYKIEEQDVLPLHVYSNATVTGAIVTSWRSLCEKGFVQLHTLSVGETVAVDDYTVTVFRSQHMATEESMIFLIEKDGKRYLHLYDTGEGVDQVVLYLQERGITVDVAALDCTYGIIEREYFGHMNANQAIRLTERFRKVGVFTSNTQVYITHFCHWGGTYEEIRKKTEVHGINVAYDGLEIKV